MIEWNYLTCIESSWVVNEMSKRNHLGYEEEHQNPRGVVFFYPHAREGLELEGEINFYDQEKSTAKKLSNECK